MHIVVVDPSRTILLCLRRILEARRHHVYPFTDGNEALRFIAADPRVDAAIVSGEQATGSGLELCWDVRLLATPVRPIHVILMSSHDAHRMIIESLDSGADDFIGKPPDVQELYARLRAAERLTSMQREVVRLATTDMLTGLLNRHAFFEQSSTTWRLSEDRPVSAIIVDIDAFRKINETYGQDAGDEVIRHVARHLARLGRTAARIGGEEFAVVLEADMAQAEADAERFRQDIASAPLVTHDGREIAVSCSVGVSERCPDDTVEDTLRRADIALYAAKADGRNRVIADHPGLWVVNDERYQWIIRSISWPENLPGGETITFQPAVLPAAVERAFAELRWGIQLGTR